MPARVFSHGSQTPERHSCFAALERNQNPQLSRRLCNSSPFACAVASSPYCEHRVRLPVCYLWMVSRSVPVRRWQSDTHSSQTLYLLSTLLLLLLALFLGTSSERELNHTADSTQRGRSGNRRSESGCLSSIISSMAFLFTLIFAA